MTLTGEERPRIAAEEAREKEDLSFLLDKKIVNAYFQPGNEGTYVLVLSDGSRAEFSASGDDATYVSFDLQRVKGAKR